jgi:hypothetical protein
MRYRSTMFGFLLRHTSTWMVWLINNMCNFGRQRILVFFHDKVHHSPRIRVWLAILGHGLLGPISFAETANSERYLSKLHNISAPHLLATGLP